MKRKAPHDFAKYGQDLAVFFDTCDNFQAFGHFFVEPLIHVASVLGGLLSQEVIKVLGGRHISDVSIVCCAWG